MGIAIAGSIVVHGQTAVAAAGTEVPLGPSTQLCYGVRIKALHGNAGWIYVGGNPVTAATGYVLDNGEEVFIEVADLASIYIDASVNADGVSYIGG